MNHHPHLMFNKQTIGGNYTTYSLQQIPSLTTRKLNQIVMLCHILYQECVKCVHQVSNYIVKNCNSQLN